MVLPIGGRLGRIRRLQLFVLSAEAGEKQVQQLLGIDPRERSGDIGVGEAFGVR